MDNDFVKPVKSFEDIELDIKPNLSETPRNASLRPGPIEPGQAQQQAPVITDYTNKNFKGQQKNEVVLSFNRRHWIVLVPSFMGFMAIIFAILGFFLIVSGNDLGAVFSPFAYKVSAFLGLSILTYAFHHFFAVFFNYFLQVVIITNFRIVKLDHTLFFSKQGDSIDLSQIQDVTLQRKGIVKTILNYGEIMITLATAHSTKILDGMPNPEYFFRKLNKTKRDYVTQRRVEKGVNPIPG